MNIISWIKKILKIKSPSKTVDENILEMTEMCNRTITSGVCPGACEKCAWGRARK